MTARGCQRLVIAPTQNREGRILLTREQRHYLKRVLRLKDGDRFLAMDGEGRAWLAQLMGPCAQTIEPLASSTELPIAVTSLVALPKGSGFDSIVRGCTELGVATLVPTISQRTLLRPSSQKMERWRKIAVEAAEQSERQVVPSILEPVDFTAALAQVEALAGDRYICVARGGANHLLTYLQEGLSPSLIVATGPEGGWTLEEVEQARKAGFQPVSLGRRILRAVSAPIAVLSLVAAVAEGSVTPTLGE